MKEMDVAGYEGWQKNNRFVNIGTGKYYYFYAKKNADRDHQESDYSKSVAYLTDGGNVIYIENETGIKVEPHYGDGTFKYIVSADNGYHLREYQDNLPSNSMQIYDLNVKDFATFVKPVPGAGPEETNQAHISNDPQKGIKITRSELTDEKYEYIVTLEDVNYYQITFKFSGAVKNASIAYKGIDGQVFTDFNGKDISISKDSAFTVQFIVNNHIPQEYLCPTLNFSPALPIGTTIIMKVNGEYWYYNLDKVETTLPIEFFTKMGGKEKFAYDAAITIPQNTIYQFIFDFSQVINNEIVDNLSITLELTANDSFRAPNINHEISLGIKDKASFNVITTSNGSTATLKCVYTPSIGNASIWNGKSSVLVLTAPSTIPADASLIVVIDGMTTTYKMNAKREFIIPLGTIASVEKETQVKVTLNSELFTTLATNYDFKVQWYVSLSGEDKWKLVDLSNEGFTLFCQKAPVPSVRIDGTKHLCHANEVLDVTINYKNIPMGGNVKAYLQSKKTNGEYIDTGLNQAISTNTGMKQTISFNMGKMDAGSYRIYVIVQAEDGRNILTVPYYFVIA